MHVSDLQTFGQRSPTDEDIKILGGGFIFIAMSDWDKRRLFSKALFLSPVMMFTNQLTHHLEGINRTKVIFFKNLIFRTPWLDLLESAKGGSRPKYTVVHSHSGHYDCPIPCLWP